MVKGYEDFPINQQGSIAARYVGKGGGSCYRIIFRY